MRRVALVAVAALAGLSTPAGAVSERNALVRPARGIGKVSLGHTVFGFNGSPESDYRGGSGDRPSVNAPPHVDWVAVREPS